MASGCAFIWYEPNQPKHVHLADDDPALPPETLKEWQQSRARREKKAVEKLAALAAGVPLPVPKRGRPVSADGPKPNTLQKRRRKSEVPPGRSLTAQPPPLPSLSPPVPPSPQEQPPSRWLPPALQAWVRPLPQAPPSPPGQSLEVRCP